MRFDTLLGEFERGAGFCIDRGEGGIDLGRRNLHPDLLRVDAVEFFRKLHERAVAARRDVRDANKKTAGKNRPL